MGKEIKLAALFQEWSGSMPDRFDRFPASGSNRRYFRLGIRGKTAIGVIGDDPLENAAFIGFTKHFRKKGLPVPEIFNTDPGEGIYLQEDLGEISLFSLLDPYNTEVNDRIRELYQKSLETLIRFQTEGGSGLDYSLCYPVESFDEQSITWDLNYFKYYFLRPSGIHYDEYALEKDFQRLIRFLSGAESGWFMFRDFQARNIFIREENPWFIDYQGGRKGPLQYDVASLLFQARARLSNAFRYEMLEYYLERLMPSVPVDRKKFIEWYYGFVLIRTLQVLGAYGYRGYFEQKPHFIASIEPALDNLRWFLDTVQLPIGFKVLPGYLAEIGDNKGPEKNESTGLTVDITSFSYPKYGYPKDASGHGGGFVFDCRALPNPGRFEEYLTLTGKDAPVIRFLEKELEVASFLEHVYRIVGQSIENYLVRRFSHLSVNFGCTGGQHRSVYCAEKLYTYLRTNYRINVTIAHKMLE